jgi:ATP adenylyltransferase
MDFSGIWAPWRVEYFKKKNSPGFLLEAASSHNDAEHLVVVRKPKAFLMLNRYPYAIGHMMAVPSRQVADIAELDSEEVLTLWDLAVTAQRLLSQTVRAQGFNIGLNLGECAGAGVVEHLHMHIVPRWEGDNNFMPVLADTKVFPEALQAVYLKLREAVEKL